MKPLNFPLPFVILAILLFTFGALINLEDIKNGEFAVLIFVGLTTIIASLIMTFAVLKTRSAENQNYKAIFNLYFIFHLCKMLAFCIFIILSNSNQLSFLKLSLFLGISIIGAFLLAKVTVTGVVKKLA